MLENCIFRAIFGMLKGKNQGFLAEKGQKKCPPLRSMGLPKCFHNGIILIVICLKFDTNV